MRASLWALDSLLAGVEAEANRAGVGAALVHEQRLAKVVDLAGELMEASEAPVALEQLLGRAAELLGAKRAAVLVLEGSRVVIERLRIPEGEEPANAWRVIGRLVDRAKQSGRSLSLASLADDPGLAAETEALGMTVGPVAVAGGAKGGLTAGLYLDRAPGEAAFSPTEMNLVEALARMAAQSLGAAKRMGEAAERRSELELAARLHEALSRTLELDQLLERVVGVTLESTNAERAFILLVSGGQITFGAARDAAGPLGAESAAAISRSVVQQVADKKEAIHVFDTGEDPEVSLRKSVVSLKLRGVVAVPLLAEGEVAGVLYIDSVSRALDGLKREQGTLEAIASVAGSAIELSRRYRQATLDAPTGLLARVFFLNRLEEELRRAVRYRRPFALIAFELRGLQALAAVNGPNAAHELMRRAGSIIRNGLRSGVDLMGRTAPDQIMVLLPETPSDGARVVAARLHAGLVGDGNSPPLAAQGPQGQVIPLQPVVALAAFPEAGATSVQLLDHAQRALNATPKA